MSRLSPVRRRRTRWAPAVAVSVLALLACQGCGGSAPSGHHSAAGPSASAGHGHLSASAALSAAAGAAHTPPAVSYLTLAQARALTATWLTTYNALYASINHTGDQKTMNKVTVSDGAAMQEEAVAHAHVDTGEPDKGLKALHWTGTPQYWVAHQQTGWPAYVVRATPQGQDVPSYYLFVVQDGKAFLLEDPEAHVNVPQPRPSFDAQGYVRLTPDAPCNAISQQYKALWNAQSPAASRRAAPSLAPDDYSLKAFPDVYQHLLVRFDTYEAPFGIALQDHQSMCMVALYNNLDNIVSILSAVTIRPADGHGVEEAAGSLLS